MKKIASAVLGSLMFLVAVLSVGGMHPLGLSAQVDGTKDTTAGNTDPSISFHLDNPLKGETTLNGFLANILDAIVLLLTPVVTIMLLYAGFLFVTAQGKVEELTKAKQALMYTLIGAAIILGAKGLAEVIQNTVSCLVTDGSC